MKKETAEHLLNKACEIITALEQWVNIDDYKNYLEKDVNAFFEEVINADGLDEEEKIIDDINETESWKADLEAQDESMGGYKI